MTPTQENSRFRWGLNSETTEECAAGLLIIALIVASSAFGDRLPRLLQNIAFVVLVVLPFVLGVISWEVLVEIGKRRDNPKWQYWTSAIGCMSQTFALVLPMVVLSFHSFSSVWREATLGLSVSACSGQSSLKGRFASHRFSAA